MANYHYKIHCADCNCWKYILQIDTDPAPTECPDNSEHTVDLNSLAMATHDDMEIF